MGEAKWKTTFDDPKFERTRTNNNNYHDAKPISTALKNGVDVKGANEIKSVSARDLARILRDGSKNASILDCRSLKLYNKGHCDHASHVVAPSQLILRRCKDKPDFWNNLFLKHFREQHETCMCSVIIIDDDYDNGGAANCDSFTASLIGKLRCERYDVMLLEKGAFDRFLSDYPELCVFKEGENMESADTSAQCMSDNGRRNSGFLTLQLKPVNDGRSDNFENQDETCPSKDKTGDPVNIIGTLYLGNGDHAASMDTLKRFDIKYILNVTCDLPNYFENKDGFKYLRIPIVDNVSKDLAPYFTAANKFIDEALEKKRGVLVHCLAGISRSVTFTVAYLMKTTKCKMEDAYDLVKKRKPNIEPNLNFLGQLSNYERHLRGGNVTPDSAVSSLSTSSSSTSSVCADSIANEGPSISTALSRLRL